MGFKRRKFTGTLKAAVIKELDGDERLSKRELLARLRPLPKTNASIRKLQAALETLIDDGVIVMDGQRAAARFRRAKGL